MIGIISDIHGNYTALLAVLAKLDSLNISNVFCLGDTVGYYPLINECCDELRRRNIPAIMGNHDWYVASKVICTRSKIVTLCAQYQSSTISVENQYWLQNLPLFLSYNNLSMVHGGWTNPLDEYLKPTDSDISLIPTQYGASGHTHKPLIKSFGVKKYCNPGSVGQPRDNDSRASFAVFDGFDFEIIRVEYSIDTFVEHCCKHDLPFFIYDRLNYGASSFKTFT